ncbi:MAG: membrane protein insertase YidC [Candidatus Omnitrophica bacterium]|nr:membrane protein insertase YidC [Candidatus Omnitrophota bacterium]
MERRAFIAIALSMMILLGWNYWMAKRYPGPGPATTPAAQAPASVGAPAPDTISQLIDKELVTNDEPETLTQVETSKYLLVFSSRGGSLREIRLKAYSNLESHESLNLVHPQLAREYSLQLIGLKGIVGTEQAMFHVKQSPGRLVYTFTLPARYSIIKEYALDDRYAVALKVTVANLSQEPMALAYQAVAGSRIDESTPFDNQFTSVKSLVDDHQFDDHLRGGFLRSQSHQPAFVQQLIGQGESRPAVAHPGATVWAGIKNRHFSAIVVPLPPAQGSWSQKLDATHLSAGALCEAGLIPPGGSSNQALLLYAGPNNLSLMRAAHPILPETVTFGGVGAISRVLLWLLNGLQRVTHNYGLAIIGLSLLVSLLLYPLTAQQLVSMKKMQTLQPHLTRLQQQHAKNPQKLNQEMVALYKKHQVNPLGGCLPLLLQMPILFALYPLLMQSVDLRGAPFLWIRDLASPDRAWTLPWALPFIGKDFNILPLLMLVAMLIQQKVASMGTSPTKEMLAQQRMMSVVFVVMWFFMFYPLPAGLVLYWLINTLMMLAAYLWLYRRSAENKSLALQAGS